LYKFETLVTGVITVQFLREETYV